LRVRQIAATQCCLLQKGSLESKLDSSVKNRQHGLVSLSTISTERRPFICTLVGLMGESDINIVPFSIISPCIEDALTPSGIGGSNFRWKFPLPRQALVVMRKRCLSILLSSWICQRGSSSGAVLAWKGWSSSIFFAAEELTPFITCVPLDSYVNQVLA